MSEMSDMFKLVNAMELAKKARVGTNLTYFDVIELLGELESLKDYIAELEAWIDKFIAEGEYLSLLNGIVPGDSNFDKLVEGYYEEREE